MKTTTEPTHAAGTGDDEGAENAGVDAESLDADAANHGDAIAGDGGAGDASEQVTVDDALAPAENETADSTPNRPAGTRRESLVRLMAYDLVPTLALLLAAGSGYLKYRSSSLQDADVARTQSVQAASEGAVAMLSYGPDDVEAKLTAAQDRLTGAFRDSYASLIKDVVIPGAKQQRIAAAAAVPAAASISATSDHAEVMVFVNQTITVGAGAPTATASAVDVVLVKVGDRWLISGFEPR